MKNITEVKAADLSKLTIAGKKAIKVAGIAGTKAETTLRACAEQLRADGIVSTCCISPASKSGLGTASPELFLALKQSVAEGMPAAIRKAFFLEGKQSEQRAADKRKAAQEVASRMNKIMKHLETLEGVVKAKPERGAQRVLPALPATPTEANSATNIKVIELLTQANKKANAEEAPTFDVIALNKVLAIALKIINTPYEPSH